MFFSVINHDDYLIVYYTKSNHLSNTFLFHFCYLTETKSVGRPGSITCAVCNVTKYYSHKQRRHGQFSCEPCSKFFSRFLRMPKLYYCDRNGDCSISVELDASGGSPSGNATTNASSGQNQTPQAKLISPQPPSHHTQRCRACWLKICLQKFNIDVKLRAQISSKYAPKLASSPNVSLIAGKSPTFFTGIACKLADQLSGV